MTIEQFLTTLKSAPNTVSFTDTINVIEANYSFKETSFTNGKTTNKAGQNSGSCKLFAFAQLNNLSKEETLACFGDYYRIDVSPILPLRLETPKPKDSRYPKRVLSVGDELRTERLERGLTQHQVAKILEVNRNFVYEMELGHRTYTIFALHKVYEFLGYIPKTLSIPDGLRGKLFIYRIQHGYTYGKMAELVGLEKSTIAKFEQGANAKEESIKKIKTHFNYLYLHCKKQI